jgi:uncharacterized RDD family membrane protein YckC
MAPLPVRRCRFALRMLLAGVTGASVALAIVRITRQATVPFAISVLFGALGICFARDVHRVGAGRVTWLQCKCRSLLALSAIAFFLLLSSFCLIGCLPR